MKLLALLLVVGGCLTVALSQQMAMLSSISGKIGAPKSFPSQQNSFQGINPVRSPSSEITVIGKDDAEFMRKKTVAIIVSIHNSGTYDALFTSKQQKSQQGTKTLVYSVPANAVGKLIEGFEGTSRDDTVVDMFKEIHTLEADCTDCTVFNWECSSGYSSQTFPEGTDQVMKLVNYVITNKHMAMFSDFSLKALIAQWDDEVLGPNPFKKMRSQFYNNVVLKFEPTTLKSSPSAQLQLVGDLAEGGKCNVHCLGGTIVYSVDMNKTDHDKYRLTILTVAENAPVDGEQFTLHIQDAKGAAGHVLLTYPNGGKLLTSMTHWIELVKVDTSEQKLFDLVARQYGTAELGKLKAGLADVAATGGSGYAYIQKNAALYVQGSSPANNLAQKANYGQ